MKSIYCGLAALTICLNSTSQYFTSPVSIPLDLGAQEEVLDFELLDLDGDGDKDLLISTKDESSFYPTGRLYMLANEDGAFGESELITEGNVLMNRLDVVDMNNDMIEELSFMGSHQSDLPAQGVYWSDNFQYEAQTVYTQFYDFISAHKVVDLNGDGLMDLINSSADHGQMLHLQEDDGTFQQYMLPVPSMSVILSGDVDGDGDVDAISLGGYNGGNPNYGIYIRENQGTGYIGSAYQAYDYVDESLDWSSLNVLDFDGNGQADLIGSFHDNDEFVAFLNLAEENQQPVPLDLPFHSCTNLLVEDIDGDGNEDFLISSASSWYVYSHLENTFSLEFETDVTSGLSLEKLKDCNSDGKMEFLAFVEQNNELLIYWNVFGDYGCMDELACNYAQDAILPGVCDYACVENIDSNNDGIINIADLLQLLSNMGCAGDDCINDINQDGIVNLTDMLLLLAWLGEAG